LSNGAVVPDVNEQRSRICILESPKGNQSFVVRYYEVWTMFTSLCLRLVIVHWRTVRICLLDVPLTSLVAFWGFRGRS
jgi:hypothetical protein